MTLRNLCVILAVTSIASACKGGDKTPPESTASTESDTTGFTAGPKEVTMIMKCATNNGIEASVQGWRRRVPKGDSITWRLVGANSVDSVVLVRVDTTAPWPFSDQNDIVVKRLGTVTRVRSDTASVDRTFHYAIKATCNLDGGVVDTVLIDPIMILPR